MDVVEGHGEGGEGEHHPLLHIALLEAVASLAHAVAGALQLLCRQPNSVKHLLTIQQIGRPATLNMKMKLRLFDWLIVCQRC